jgi:hypothetical protein
MRWEGISSEIRGGRVELRRRSGWGLGEILCCGVGQLRSFAALRMTGQSNSRKNFGGARRNRTADKGFADLCLTTWRPRHRGKSCQLSVIRFQLKKQSSPPGLLRNLDGGGPRREPLPSSCLLCVAPGNSCWSNFPFRSNNLQLSVVGPKRRIRLDFVLPAEMGCPPRRAPLQTDDRLKGLKIRH